MDKKDNRRLLAGQNMQTFFNFISMLVRMGFGFFAMPLFTRLLDAEQYGMHAVYISWLGILTCFMGLGCGQGLANGIYRFPNHYYEFRSSIMVGYTAVSGGLLLLICLFGKQLSNVLEYPFWLVFILFLEAFAHYTVNFASSAWTYEKSAEKNMLTTLVILIVSTLLSVWLLWVWPVGAPNKYYGWVFGNALSYVIVAAVIWVNIFLKHPAGFSREYWRYSFHFGIPLIFHTLSHQVLVQSDRVMMQKMDVFAGDIGIYSFFYSFSSVLTTILNALNTSWCPYLYDDLSKQSYEKLNQRLRNYVKIFTVLTCGYLMVSREVAMLFSTEGYWAGLNLLPFFVLSAFMTFIYQFSVNYEFYMEQPRIVALGTLGAAGLNFFLNFLLIPRYGMYGAALATLVSYITLALIHYIVVTHWKKVRYPLTFKPIINGLVMVSIATAGYYALKDLWVLRWGMGAVMGGYLTVEIIKRKSIF